MAPATLRRLLVFGVCLVGIGCLYLLPSIAGSSHRAGSSPTRDLPAAGRTDVARASVTTAALAPGTAGDLVPRPTTLSSGAAATSTAPQRDDRRRAEPATRPAATAKAPGEDDHPPAPVGRLTVLHSDQDRLTVAWPEARDDIGVVGYQVVLNGFLVLVTYEPRATLAWFNDSNTHVIQIRALDGAGNAGPSSPTLLVSRPAQETTSAAPAQDAGASPPSSQSRTAAVGS